MASDWPTGVFAMGQLAANSLQLSIKRQGTIGRTLMHSSGSLFDRNSVEPAFAATTKR